MRQRRALDERQSALRGIDPSLDQMIARYGPARLRGPVAGSRRFENLARAIAYQQLNGVAAGTIWSRVVERLGRVCSPATVLTTPDDDLRSCGLSGAKVRALNDLALHVDDGRLALSNIGRLDDGEIVTSITQVWGLGRWSAHMFMMSSLGRLDVWPVDDFGVRRGFALAWGLSTQPTVAEIEPLGEPFIGSRSLVAWYCWAAADDPSGAV